MDKHMKALIIFGILFGLLVVGLASAVIKREYASNNYYKITDLDSGIVYNAQWYNKSSNGSGVRFSSTDGITYHLTRVSIERIKVDK